MGSPRVRCDWSDLTHTHMPQSCVSFSVRWLSSNSYVLRPLTCERALKALTCHTEIRIQIIHIWWGFSLKVVSDTCNAVDCSPPGSSVHGIFQARILERVAISFSRGSSQPRDWTWVSCTAGRFFTDWAAREFPSLIFRPPEMAYESTTRVVIYNCLCQINYVCGYLFLSYCSYEMSKPKPSNGYAQYFSFATFIIFPIVPQKLWQQVQVRLFRLVALNPDFEL